MTYEVLFTEKVAMQYERAILYLLEEIKSKQAKDHLQAEMRTLVRRMRDNPFQFPIIDDPVLATRDYRQAVLPDMFYKVIFRIEGGKVYILGFFHDRENYQYKVTE